MQLATDKMDSKAEQALKLRQIRFKHAGAIANRARIIAMAASNLLKIESKIHEESIAIAGEDYQRFHEISFDADGSMQEQFQNGGYIICPGFLDIKNCAAQVVAVASAVAAAESAPPPPSEEEFIENENDI